MTGKAQISVLPANDSILGLKKAGLVYCLPQTNLNIRLLLNKTVRTKGIYAANAREMLSIDNANMEERTDYNLSIKGICENAIPDPAQYYVATLKKPLCKPGPRLMLSPQSFLLGLNKKEKIKEDKDARIIEEQPVVTRKSPLACYNYHINADLFKTIAADTSAFPKYIFRVKNTDDPIIKKARNAVENLARIKENKTNLLGGYQEIPYDKSTLEIMLKGLEEEEEKVLSLFTGSTETISSVITVPYLPVAGDSLPVVIGHFSSKDGFSTDPLSDALAVTLTLNPIRNYSTVKEPKQKKSSSIRKKGLVVREPAWVTAEIRIGEEMVFTQTICLPQFGYTYTLPGKTKKALFDARSGAVKMIQ
jgi:hypothetical protein